MFLCKIDMIKIVRIFLPALSLADCKKLVEIFMIAFGSKEYGFDPLQSKYGLTDFLKVIALVKEGNIAFEFGAFYPKQPQPLTPDELLALVDSRSPHCL